MSDNIRIFGTRDVKVIKTGDIETQVEQIEVFQTPTTITRAILSHSNPLEAYKNYILDLEVDHPNECLAELDKAISELIARGYDIEFGYQ